MAAEITKKTNVTPAKTGPQRYQYEAAANGVAGAVKTTVPVPITAEPITINGRVGLVFRNAQGEPIKYVLREA